ncbi:hypothetical protein [Paenibacillus illinoisensis]|uniref:hypothetical protein n=1 Tax=Paenibacillus illinoisensis TaxID=59845 RepID=UPI00301C4D9B
MKSTTDSIGEVFLFAWEMGLRIKIDPNEDPAKNYHELSDEDLLVVGWDHPMPPVEADDIDFITQYIHFKKIYDTEAN